MMDARARRIARGAAIGDAALAASVLLGWLFGAGAPKGTKVGAAVGLLLASFALWREASPSGGKTAIGRAAAAGVVAIALITPIAFLAGAEIPAAALRMAPNTAFALLLAGLALLLVRREPRAAQGLAAGTVAIGYVALAGHAYGAPVLYLVERGAAMAMPAAAALAILGVGVLAVDTTRGFARTLFDASVAGRTVRRLLVAVTAVPFALGWLRLEGQRRGLYGTELGTSLFVTVSSATLAALVLWHGHLQRLEVARRERAIEDQRFLLSIGELLRSAAASPSVQGEVAKRLSEHLQAPRASFVEVDPEAVKPDGPTTFSVPLRRDGKWVASLVVGSEVPRKWDPREVELIETVAERTWTWIEHRRSEEALIEEVQALARVLEGRVEERTRELAAAVESLRRSEAGFRALIEHAPDGIIVHAEGVVLYANRAMLRTLGAERLEGTPLLDVVHPDDRPRVLQRLAEQKTDPRTRPGLEVRVVTRTGDVRWVEAPAIPLDYKGTPAVVVLVRDVTERHDAERVLRENVARFETIFDASPSSLWEVDFSDVAAYLRQLEARTGDLRAHLAAHPECVMEAAGKQNVLAVNRKTLEKLESAGIAELRRGLPRIFGAEGLATFRDQLVAFLDGETTFQADTILYTLKGAQRHVTVRLSVVAGHEEDWSRVLISMVDITHLKRVEEHLRRSLAEKEVLLKEVHHRVKNNLQVVSSLLKLQSHRVPEPAARDVLAETRARIQSIALVHEKLYGSKDLAHVSFGSYLENLMESLLHALSARSRGIRAEIEVGDVELAVDKAIPCGMLVNELVTNALKHAFPGNRPGTVRVRLVRDGPRHRLEVEDDGKGLPPELDPRDTRTLGMDLVQTFAHQLGAEMEVARDGGTRFSFVFVASREVDDAR